MLSRRAFIRATGIAAGGLLANQIGIGRTLADWRALLPIYAASAWKNVVVSNGRRALRSAALYPGIYVRDALFWGPLALKDAALGYECYQWFAESQLASGQIRSAVPLQPGEADLLQPQDDEGTLLFVIASGWLHGQGYAPDRERVEAAFDWIRGHVTNGLYVSAAGPFRYWADTVSLDREDTVAYNQGLLCLAYRAMIRLRMGHASSTGLQQAIAGYRAFDSGQYVRQGMASRFAEAMDQSAIFPEFLSRYLYSEPLLDDQSIVRHVNRLVEKASVYDRRGKMGGIKVLCGPDGEFLPSEWYLEPSLNTPGGYHNGGYWPMFTLVGLALAYQITRDPRYEDLIGRLVVREAGRDPRSKEVFWLDEARIGTFDPNRTDYTWNALIKLAVEWAGLA